MTTPSSGDALARLTDETAFQLWDRFAGRGGISSEDARREQWERTHNRDYWRKHASLLVTAIASQVERETIERCRNVADSFEVAVGEHIAGHIHMLPPRYGGNPT